MASFWFVFLVCFDASDYVPVQILLCSVYSRNFVRLQYAENVLAECISDLMTKMGAERGLACSSGYIVQMTRGVFLCNLISLQEWEDGLTMLHLYQYCTTSCELCDTCSRKSSRIIQ